jgi:3-dehydroquinate synthase
MPARTTEELVTVDLPGRVYDIVIAPGALDQLAPRIAAITPRKRVTVITENTVAAHHLERLENALSTAGIAASVLTLPAGETTKSWRYLEQSVEWLIAQKVERGDVVIAFGGGVIGDLVGFAAAVLRRGVRFVQIPTSLLAQVDSSVGGKTGINSPLGKNLIGAFHQPSLVVADVSLLDTLPPRDFLSGYGEVLKYGLLGDAVFFEWLEENGPALAAGDVEKRVQAVKRSCQMKADIVLRDETEQGDRALLNLGHTFCHAIEAATNYDASRLVHGEGVAIGCALAFEVSARLGFCAQEDPSRLRAHIAQMGMKCDLRDIPGDLPNAETLFDLMGQDKKVRDGTINFVMARGIGQAFVTSEVSADVVKQVLSESAP